MREPSIDGCVRFHMEIKLTPAELAAMPVEAMRCMFEGLARVAGAAKAGAGAVDLLARASAELEAADAEKDNETP